MKIKYLVGSKKISNNPSLPFGKEECKFLNDVSRILNSNKQISNYSDIKSLAFWCRERNISILKKKFDNSNIRLGLGLLFHITPSNVPTNFFFSLILGLLTGNSNIIKLPSQNFDQTTIICNALNKALVKNTKIRNRIAIIQYSGEDHITQEISSKCNGRLIWGGDKTIEKIKNLPSNSRLIDIPFADRYSLAIINAKEVLKLNKAQLFSLSKNFFNDTFKYDQNACTSPHLIMWDGNKKQITNAKKIFWGSLLEIVKDNYLITNHVASERLNFLYKIIAHNNNLGKVTNYKNMFYTFPLNKISSDNHNLRGKWGIFFETNLKNINHLKKHINNKYQTLTYFGFKKEYFQNFILKNKPIGIDRIVPIGSSMDLSFYWDGYNIQNILTRSIDIT